MKTLVRNYDSFPVLFNEFLNSNSKLNNSITPLANIKESETAFEIELAIPGFKKDDFKVEVHDKSLTISSVSNSETEESKDNYVRKEFSYASFSRSFKLPITVDTDKIEASYESGVLNLTLPKKEEAKAKEPRLIAIN